MKILNATIKFSDEELKGCSIPQFYDKVGASLGYADALQNIEYDSRKITIAKNIQDMWYELYKEEDRKVLTNVLLVYGPKVDENLPNNTVCVEPGFICQKPMEVNLDENIDRELFDGIVTILEDGLYSSSIHLFALDTYINESPDMLKEFHGVGEVSPEITNSEVDRDNMELKFTVSYFDIDSEENALLEERKYVLKLIKE